MPTRQRLTAADLTEQRVHPLGQVLLQHNHSCTFSNHTHSLLQTLFSSAPKDYRQISLSPWCGECFHQSEINV